MRPAGIIVLLIFIWYGEQAFSQNNSFTPEWSFGVNGGVTFSKVGFNSYISVPQESLQQLSGGITVRYLSENHFGIHVEMNYSQRGWKEKTDSVYINRYARSLSYIEIPILTHIYFNLGKRVRLIFNLGPQISYYIGEKDIEREIYDFKENEKGDSYYNIAVEHPFDYGIKVSGGLEFRTKAGSIILDGRYYYGLSDIFNNTKADSFQASHSQVTGVNLSYLFR